ncbi:MAG TPA: SWIM zinc finger family protein [Thermoanaerobaculia bacterium]|jgi:uncharacterized Zn finger protein
MAWYDNPFPAAKPIVAKGGIRARSKRGDFATKWWGRRWLAVLEALNLGGRLQRGRTYARKGQVLDLDIEPGTVRARVQGSMPKPYAVTLGVRKLTPKETPRLAAELERNPYCLAKLLAREMPPEIEGVFEAADVSLFPARASELKTECSCPDWSNPCKHIAAVYYLLGEEFDRDPFLIFRLRGIDTAALIGSGPVATLFEPPEARVDDLAGEEPFWEGGRAAALDLAAEPPRDPAVLVRLLGNLPFWRGEQPLTETLAPAYERGAAAALALLVGEGSGER